MGELVERHSSAGCRSMVVILSQRKCQAKDSHIAHRLIQAQLAMVGVDDFASQGEPQAKAVNAPPPRLVDPVKAVEDFLAILRALSPGPTSGCSGRASVMTRGSSMPIRSRW